MIFNNFFSTHRIGGNCRYFINDRRQFSTLLELLLFSLLTGLVTNNNVISRSWKKVNLKSTKKFLLSNLICLQTLNKIFLIYLTFVLNDIWHHTWQINLVQFVFEQPTSFSYFKYVKFETWQQLGWVFLNRSVYSSSKCICFQKFDKFNDLFLDDFP